jgi:hypothetical protein
MAPNDQSSDAVWISKEEYDRLRTAAGQAAPEAVVISDAGPRKKDWLDGFLKTEVLLLVAAVLVLLALVVNSSVLALISGPLITVFVIVGIMTFIRYYNGLKQVQTATMSQAEIQDNARKRKIAKAVLVTAGIMAASVFIMPILGVVFVILLLSFGGGDIGS